MNDTIKTISSIRLEDYTYDLPDDGIAKFPLPERDASKLLIYRNGAIQHRIFKDIVSELDSRHTLFFNNTKVIPARLYFQKESGALIEIFLLNPIQPIEINEAMRAKGSCLWACAIGNLKRWKNHDLKIAFYTEGGYSTEKREAKVELEFKAILENRQQQIVRFEWHNDLSFAEILTLIGKTPLPPYLNRRAEETDKSQYQTVYAQNKGAVAAPTAGLHFTEGVLSALKESGVEEQFLTLHIAGGTFQPIRTGNLTEHTMHAEQIEVSKETIEAISKADKIVAVGTTSMRTLESLYWYGVKLKENPEADFQIEKLYPYQRHENLPNLNEAMWTLLESMRNMKIQKLFGSTEIMIVPPYTFRVCDGLVTNFHLPGTTLIFLVAAFIGEDWQKVYAEALEKEYRFLSFGDSSLLWRRDLS